MHYKQVTASHSVLDTESCIYNHLLIRGLRVNPAMTNWRDKWDEVGSSSQRGTTSTE